MRISDWSSDVCSSDLLPQARGRMRGRLLRRAGGRDQRPLPREARHHGGGRVAGWPEMTARPQNRMTAGWSGFIDPATGWVDGANPACDDRTETRLGYWPVRTTPPKTTPPPPPPTTHPPPP